MVAINYADERELVKRFLMDFKSMQTKTADEELAAATSITYADLLIKLAHRESNDLIIELDHIFEFDSRLATAVVNNARRYVDIFADVVQDLLPRYSFSSNIRKDFLDNFIEHRILAQSQVSSTTNSGQSQLPITDASQQLTGSGSNSNVDLSVFPKELMRRFEIHFRHFSNQKSVPLRQIKAESIGKLVHVKGIVIRSSDVKPLISVATYVCDKCGAETYQPVNSSSFIPIEMCPSQRCVSNKLGGRLQLQTRGSKFIRHQEIKLQEHSDQVPVGSVPRAVNIIAIGSLTRLVVPGDHIQCTGIFLPCAKTGFRQILQGLLADTYLEAHDIRVVNKFDIGHVASIEKELNDELAIATLLTEPNLYNKLAYSISPEIYGHEDIKKALLLLMVGGVSTEKNGMKIRGNINILLMGDPGVAKSQLLSYIDRLAFRSQLTTGRGSSSVGLTAAVVRDPATNDITLEGGALVLADQGICCIDEFDKMDENDRASIHEVMEQQTISIAKAGISTTLNARVSILAAANPIYGRYNVRKSIEHNIQLPASLLSRFDLIWLIKDKVDEENDIRLAEHIAHVHQHLVQPASDLEPIPIELMRKFIQKCQLKQPKIAEKELKNFIVAAYIEMRKESREESADSTYVSPRTLLSIIRLSTALARLRMADIVNKEDIEEAIRLMEFSKISIQPDTQSSKNIRPQDAIYNIIRDLALIDGSKNVVDYDQAKMQCLSNGYTFDQFEICVNDYEDLNVWLVNSDRTKINII